VVAVLGLIPAGWWLVDGLMEEPGRRLAALCATGPAAHQPIVAAGGPAAAAAEPEVLAPYTRVPALTERWLGDVRGQASRSDDRELTRAAFLALRAGGVGRSLSHLAEVERRCAVHMEAHEVPPAPADWFRP
jgi:hypothetical protein